MAAGKFPVVQPEDYYHIPTSSNLRDTVVTCQTDIESLQERILANASFIELLFIPILVSFLHSVIIDGTLTERVTRR